MNQIVNKFLLAGSKFMPEMDLRKHGFTNSACVQFTKNKQRIQTFIQIIFARMNWINLVFNMIWLMANTKNTIRYSLKRKSFCNSNNPKYETEENQQLPNELHKPIIRKFREQKKCILVGVNIADMLIQQRN